MNESNNTNMPVEFNIKVMKLGTGLAVVIPKPVTTGFKIQAGDKLKLLAVANEIKLCIPQG